MGQLFCKNIRLVMNSFLLSTRIFLALLFLSHHLWAGPDVGGYVETDTRWRPGGTDQYTWNENRVGLKINIQSEGASGHGELRFRHQGFADINRSDQLWDSDRIQPSRLEIYEGYIDIYGLLLDNLDMRIGKQRIAWGTADKLNVVDNLNPDDFEDILDLLQGLMLALDHQYRLLPGHLGTSLSVTTHPPAAERAPMPNGTNISGR